MRRFRRLGAGSTVWVDDVAYTIAEIVSLKEVVLTHANGKQVTKPLADLRVPIGRKRRFDLAKVPEGFAAAEDIHREVANLLQIPDGERTTEQVEAAAKELKVHRSSVYRYLAKGKKSLGVSVFLRLGRSDQGKTRLDPERKKIVEDAIDSEYLTEQRKPARAVVDEVTKKCKEKGLKPVHRNTVYARIKQIPKNELDEKRYGGKYAAERYTPLTGSFPGADYPLAVVQMDHTPIDVILVDDVTREPINRAYITLAIDVYSRMVVGFYISLDPPGALSTGLCLSNAILPKKEFLQSVGLDPDLFDWPCWGKMDMIHTDNAKEFRGTMMARAAKEHGLIAERRPKGQPKFGGHVERGFRTFMARVHELPGTTFSNVQARVDYDSAGKAVMSLNALRTWFTAYIAGVYNHSPHAGLNDFPPIHVWTEGMLHGSPGMPGPGTPEPVENPERLRLDFLPFFEGTVQEDGIRWNNIKWFSHALVRLIPVIDPKTGRKRRYTVRYDARDLSRLWLFEPDREDYIEVPYANLLRFPVSLWEVKRANKRLRAEAKLATNEEMIFRTIAIMRDIVTRETETTAKARAAAPKRQAQRQRDWAEVQATHRAAAEARDGESHLSKLAQNDEDDDDDDFELPAGIREDR